MNVEVYIRHLTNKCFKIHGAEAQIFVDKFIKEKGTFITVTGDNYSAVFRREEISAVIVNKEDEKNDLLHKMHS